MACIANIYLRLRHAKGSTIELLPRDQNALNRKEFSLAIFAFETDSILRVHYIVQSFTVTGVVNHVPCLLTLVEPCPRGPSALGFAGGS